MVAGTRTIRTRVASMQDRGGQADAEHLGRRRPRPARRPRKTATMISGGGRDDPAGARRCRGPPPARSSRSGDVLLADAGEQEHLVVHGQPEQDGEHEHRDEGHDRHGRLEPDQRAAPAPLEDHDHHAVGGADAQQVEQHRLERHQHRPERRASAAGRTSPATAPMNTGSRSWTRSPDVGEVRGLPADVGVAGLPASAAGRPRLRSRVTVSWVAASCGPVVGTATSVATPARVDHGPVQHRPMPGSAAIARATASTASGSPRQLDGDDERAVAARTEALGHEVVRLPFGAARRQRAVVGDADPQRDDRRGQRQQHQARRRHGVPARVPRDVTRPPLPPGARRGARRRLPATRRPATASSAGSRVTDATTMTSTTSEIAMPPAVMNGTPATASPRIDTMTMPPANTTGRPAVRQRAGDRLVARAPGAPGSRGAGSRRTARSRCRRRAPPWRRAPARSSGTVMTDASSVMLPMPTASPRMAIPTGRSAATNEPNARSRMTSAAAMPTRLARVAGRVLVREEQVATHLDPQRRVLRHPLEVHRGRPRRAGRASGTARARSATRPSGETTPLDAKDPAASAPAGSVVPSTCGSAATSAWSRARAVACGLVGHERAAVGGRDHDLRGDARLVGPPDAAIRSLACCESRPGTVKVSSSLAPEAPAAPTTTTASDQPRADHHPASSRGPPAEPVQGLGEHGFLRVSHDEGRQVGRVDRREVPGRATSAARFARPPAERAGHTRPFGRSARRSRSLRWARDPRRGTTTVGAAACTGPAGARVARLGCSSGSSSCPRRSR